MKAFYFEQLILCFFQIMTNLFLYIKNTPHSFVKNQILFLWSKQQKHTVLQTYSIDPEVQLTLFRLKIYC